MFTLLIIYGIKNILTDTRKVMTTQFSNSCKETLCSKTENQLIRIQEILEGRRKEAEFRQEEIQRLISEIAHQMRTPLANIKNYTELLQESSNETGKSLNTEYNFTNGGDDKLF